MKLCHTADPLFKVFKLAVTGECHQTIHLNILFQHSKPDN
jgi:hypothetical protein